MVIMFLPFSPNVMMHSFILMKQMLYTRFIYIPTGIHYLQLIRSVYKMFLTLSKSFFKKARRSFCAFSIYNVDKMKTIFFILAIAFFGCHPNYKSTSQNSEI